jgi:hypothetical protein
MSYFSANRKVTRRLLAGDKIDNSVVILSLSVAEGEGSPRLAGQPRPFGRDPSSSRSCGIPQDDETSFFACKICRKGLF